jgi:hypothetical protein
MEDSMFTSKPDYQREFSNYCDDVIRQHDWVTSVDLDDLQDDEKQELTRLCSLARYNRHSEIELICEGNHLDELVPMLQMYLKDNTRADELAKLLAKQAFSACDTQIKEQLEYSLAEHRSELGYESDNDVNYKLDTEERHNNLRRGNHEI